MKTIYLLLILLSIAHISTAEDLFPFSNYNTKKKNEKTLYGFKDKAGNVVVPLKYHSVYVFDEGFCKVILNGKIGLINDKGYEIVPPIYDDMGALGKNLVYVYLNGKESVINMKGKLLAPLKYDKVLIDSSVIWVKLDGKWGIFDTIGNVIAPIQYTFYHTEKPGRTRVFIGDKLGYIDEQTGKEIIPIIYNEISTFENGSSLAKRNNKFGCIDKETGKEIIPVIYDEIIKYKEEPFLKAKLNGKWGLIDDKGKEVIPFKYENFFNYSDDIIDLVNVELDSKYGLFSLKLHKELITPQYDEIKLDGEREDKFIKVIAINSAKAKMGLIDTATTKLFIPIKYDQISSYYDNLATVAIDTNRGFVNLKGIEVVPVKYKHMQGNLDPDPYELMKKDENGKNALDYANEISVEDGNLLAITIKNIFITDSIQKENIKNFNENMKANKLSSLPSWDASFNYDCTYSTINKEKDNANDILLNKKLEINVRKYFIIFRNMPEISEKYIDIPIMRSDQETKVEEGMKLKYYYYFFEPNKYGILNVSFLLKDEMAYQVRIQKNKKTEAFKFFCK